MFEDKTLVCKDCGKEFVFTAGEQEFYAEKGFQNEPMRCKECRIAKKQALRETVKCIQPYAQLAAKKQRFPSFRRMTGRSIAANVSQITNNLSL